MKTNVSSINRKIVFDNNLLAVDIGFVSSLVFGLVFGLDFNI